MPFSEAVADIAGMSLIFPISLLECIMDIRKVLSVTASLILPGEILPLDSGSMYVISKPNLSERYIIVSRTAICSMEEVIMWFLPEFRCDKAIPLSAKLLDSVPPEVKKISLGLAPMNAAIMSLESSRATLAGFPRAWMDDALPYFSVKYGIISATTVSPGRVVEALSKYIFFI